MKFFIKVFLWALLITVIIAGVYAFYLNNEVKTTVDNMYFETNKEKEEKIQKRDTISFLLLGIDSKESEKGRSDVIIVATVNPHTNSINMVSIPRDTLTLIKGRGYEDKINHSYAFGGPDMTIATVENYLDIPIDYFASVNMWGFRDMVDAVGGVTVYNDLHFIQNQYTFNKGDVYLTGDKALSYVRHRKTDPKGDLGRSERQKQVINAIVDKVSGPTAITKVQGILEVLGSNVKTNLSYDEMITLLTDYRGTKDNINSLHLTGGGVTINNIYYYSIPDEERNRVSGELKEHLEI
ncbi:LCP family protein [Rossellomorea aquimaris]|nr:LCP family protein [Rossellomorea aquimaris]